VSSFPLPGFTDNDWTMFQSCSCTVQNIQSESVSHIKATMLFNILHINQFICCWHGLVTIDVTLM